MMIALAIATVSTWMFHSPAVSGTVQAPAGFGRGVVHGAMMPATLPYLLLGRDVPIYAEHNSGRFYKLGYTAGVNVCGAVFFGFFYWRLSRWRKNRAAAAPS
ncbi:MAG: hypothetical protein AB1705_23255 [Verrucomicrobiota bacterium]